ncbi:MAG: ribonuclease P protein component [Chitinophagaceae bacterium]
MKPFSLTKHERLKSKKDMDTLFSQGEAFFVFPFKVFFIFKPLSTHKLQSPQFGVAAPKKIFKKASSRNYAKRLAREAYRLNKANLYSTLQEQSRSVQLMLLYVSDKDLHFEHIQKAIQKINHKILEIGK